MVVTHPFTNPPFPIPTACNTPQINKRTYLSRLSDIVGQHPFPFPFPPAPCILLSLLLSLLLLLLLEQEGALVGELGEAGGGGGEVLVEVELLWLG